jgi:hypothetical protein
MYSNGVFLQEAELDNDRSEVEHSGKLSGSILGSLEKLVESR